MMEIYMEQAESFLKYATMTMVGFIIAAVMILGFMSQGRAFAAEAQPQTDKVSILYFWGAECPHCAHLKPWLDEFEKSHSDTVQLNRYEFWHDQDNAQLFFNTMKYYQIPEDQMGAPAIVVNNKVFIGTKDIKDNLETEYQAALKTLQEQRKNAKGEGLLTEEIDLGSQMQDKPHELAAITAAALADSINPCAMMVLIILLSSLMVMHKEKSRIAMTALSFIAASYIAYFFIGIGLTQAITVTGASQWVVTAVGSIAIVVGLAELKDAFWGRAGGWSTEIPEAWRGKLSKLLLSVTGPAGAFVAGLAVTFFELPCTGGPYLFGLSLISQHSETGRFLLLAYYNLIFILPLVIISVLAVASKVSIERAEEFRNRHAKTMHLIVGVAMLAMGVWALFFR